ncbi:MAG: hypothetical protein OEY72_12945 [Gammaproteobacteria bacterium]|nr:hypothetical protein [Gammaproteobacteria bacterium]
MTRPANAQVTRSRAIRGSSLLCLLILLLAGTAHATRAVLVVYDPESAAHRTIVDSLRNSDAVNSAGSRRAEIRELIVAELDEDRLLETKAGLIITVGTRAAANLSKFSTDVPILNVFLPRAGYEQLYAKATDTAAAIVLDQPIERQLALARVLLPRAKRVGALVGASSGSDVEAMQQAVSLFALNLDVVRVTPEEHPVDAIERLLLANEMIITTFDREAYSPTTAKWLLYLAFQQRRPIIGFSYALLKAGAVGAVFSTPEQIAKHTGELLDGWLSTGRLPAGPVFPRYYHIGLNAPVAEKLGLSPPSNDAIERQVHELLGDVR